MRDALGGLRAEALDQRLQVDAVEQLHHVVEGAFARDAEVVELDRVRGAQRRRGARLAREQSQQPLRILRVRGRSAPSGRISFTAAGRASMR